MATSIFCSRSSKVIPDPENVARIHLGPTYLRWGQVIVVKNHGKYIIRLYSHPDLGRYEWHVEGRNDATRAMLNSEIEYRLLHRDVNDCFVGNMDIIENP